MTQKLKKIKGIYHAPVAVRKDHPRGRTKWISTGSDNKSEAQKVLAESGVERLNVAAKAGRLTSKAIGQALTGKHLTCQKAFDKYRELRGINLAEKTLANHVAVIANWMKDVHAESKPPASITPQQIDQWINNPESDWKRGTRLMGLAAVRGFFGFCAEQGWIVSNPARQVEVDFKVMSHEQKEADPVEPFADAEIKLLIKELRKDWKRSETGKSELFRDRLEVLFWLVAVVTARDTGLRLGDIAQLEWRSFEKQGKLAVWTGKKDKRVELPISEELQELVSEIPVDHPDYVFPVQRTVSRDVKKRFRLSVYFGRLCERLGIKGKTFHSFRHYKATDEYVRMDKLELAAKLAETLTMEQIAALLGHANAKTTKRYIHDT